MRVIPGRLPSARSAAAAALVACLGVAVAAGASWAGADSGSGAARPVSVRTTTASSLLPNVVARPSATWCGTASDVDAKPNAVAGHPVHWIYAIPADGENRFATYAHAMQTDAEAIDAWWRSQDSARVPRNDVAPFACGLQLDLSTVRLGLSGSQLAAPQTPFDLVWDDLAARGFGSRFGKYVVYYDGPVGDEDICGVGGTIPNGLGMAVVQVRACAGISTAQVAVHELVHAMGAVPSGAPHMCAPPDDGHTCDDTRDLMYPYSDGTPLGGLTLDPGRDDYYGHSGSWLDVQDSPWLVQADRQAQVSLSISGPGRVEGDVPGLLCSQSCTTTWNAGTRIALAPTPGPGARLIRWSGPCSGASLCVVTAGESPAVSALFAPATYRVRVSVKGKGAVRSSIFGIACPGRCASPFASYTQLRLRATPAKGWRLKSWTGACRGTRALCSLPMSSDATARAVFVRR